MGVRFDAAGEYYSRAFNLGDQNSYTICCWAKVNVLRSGRNTIWYWGGTSGNFLQLYFDQSSGSLVPVVRDTGGSVNPVVALNVNTWYYFGLTSRDEGTLVWRAADSSTFRVDDGLGLTFPHPFSTFWIGANASGGEWLNGCVAAVKIWAGTALTAEELMAEAEQAEPVKAGVTAYYRFFGPSVEDDSGNGWTLSGGVGATQEGDPLGTRVLLDDAGIAADSLGVAAGVGLTDAGVGAELFASARLVDLAEAGAGVEAPAAAASVLLGDLASGGDAVVLGQPVFVEEPATAADTLGVAAATAVADAGAGAETLGVTAAALLADTGTGLDAMLGGLLLHKALGDEAAGVDDLVGALVPEITYVGWPRVRWSAGRPRT